MRYSLALETCSGVAQLSRGGPGAPSFQPLLHGAWFRPLKLYLPSPPFLLLLLLPFSLQTFSGPRRAGCLQCLHLGVGRRVRACAICTRSSPRVAGRWDTEGSAPFARAAIVRHRYLDLTDADGFERECRQGRALGFDGKTLIHPVPPLPHPPSIPRFLCFKLLFVCAYLFLFLS